MQRMVLALAVAAGPTLLAAAPAVSADMEPRVVIALKEADERRQVFQPKGIPVGAALLHGAYETRLTMDDNVFAEVAAPNADLVAAFAPSLSLRTGPVPWDVRLEGQAEAVRYRDHPRLDHVDFRSGIGVHGESWNRSRAHAVAEVARRHEQPGEPDHPGAALEPVPVLLVQLDGGVLLRSGRLFVGGGAAVRRLTYDAVAAQGGGILAQDHRDRWEVDVVERVGFAPTATVDLFVEARERVRLYDRLSRTGLVDRGSEATALLVGMAIDLNERMAGEMVWGRTQVAYASPLFPDLSRPIVAGALTVSVTPLTAVSGRVWQSVEETDALLQASVVEEGWRLAVEHELLRNLILRLEGGRLERAYHGLVEGEGETEAHIRAAGEYRFDARWFLGVEGRWDERESSARLGSYTRNRLTLRAGARL